MPGVNNFEEWKWRKLRGRRTFYFFFINVILALAWFTISNYDIPTNVDAPGGNVKRRRTLDSPSSRANLDLMYGVPLFFQYLHVLTCALLLFTKWGGIVIHESQGRRLMLASVLSLVLVALYLLLPLMYNNPTLSESQRMALFSTITIVIVSCIHNLGLPQSVFWMSNLAVIILWSQYIQAEVSQLSHGDTNYYL